MYKTLSWYKNGAKKVSHAGNKISELEISMTQSQNQINVQDQISSFDV